MVRFITKAPPISNINSKYHTDDCVISAIKIQIAGTVYKQFVLFYRMYVQTNVFKWQFFSEYLGNTQWFNISHSSFILAIQ